MQRVRERGQVRHFILLLVVFVAGMALSATWFYVRNSHGAKATTGAESALSGNTEAVLQNLQSPVVIRYYSLLDPASVPEPTRAFANRVSQMLSNYEQQAKGRIKVVRYDSQSNSNANAALADGIKPFNLDKGDGCYLGVTVDRDGQKQTLPYLSPEWEQALEFDLTRAIARPDAPKPAPPPPPTDTAAVDAVKQAIPNPDAVSLEDGTRMLRSRALAEFAQATQDMEAAVKAAQQNLLQAQNGQSDAERQAALKALQQVQADETEKLKQIAANSKAQIDAFTQMKSAPTPH